MADGDPVAERTVHGEWKGGWLCEVDAGEFRLVVDEPESVGGSNLGPQPTELLLASISSCFTLALAYAANKRSLELSAITVDVTGTYDGPSFSSIKIVANVGCPESELSRLLQIAERVCYVTNTLRGGVELILDGIAIPAN